MIEKNLKHKFVKIDNENSVDFSKVFSEGVADFTTLRIYNSTLDVGDLTIFRNLISLILSNVKFSNLFGLESSFFNNIRYLELDGKEAMSLLNKYSFAKVSRLHLSNISYFKCHLQHLLFIEELVIKSVEKLELVSFPTTFLYALKIVNCNLININESIFKPLSLLEYLELNFLKLRQVPSFVFDFERLQVLSLSGNFIKRIPKELSKLKLLRQLSLTNMEIDTFDYEFYKALDLSHLRLDNTSISIFPKKFKLEQIYLFISLENTQLHNYSEAEFNLLVNEYMHDCD